MYAYTTGARSYEEEPEATSLLLATSSSPSTSSTSASAVGPVFDSCRKKRIIIRFDTFGRDVSTYERRATSEAVSVRRASVVRTALRPIRTKKSTISRLDLNATRRERLTDSRATRRLLRSSPSPGRSPSRRTAWDSLQERKRTISSVSYEIA